MVGPFSWEAYIHAYLVYIIPNLFLFSAIVFGVTLFTRSIIASFITVAILFFASSMASSLIDQDQYEVLGALLDPFGLDALTHYTKYWTIAEQNENLLPLAPLIVQNRILWTGIALMIFGFSYRMFRFDYSPISWKFWKTNQQDLRREPSDALIQSVELPQVNYRYDFIQALRSSWSLATIELKYILRGGPFIVVSIIAALMMIVFYITINMFLQTQTLPVTKDMLLVPGTVFRMFITLLTFVYAGMLLNRPVSTKIFQLEDATSARTWSFLFSKVISLTGMQIVLLSIIILTGIGIQVYNQYYNFEIDLYLKDLYGVRLIYFISWSLLALFIYSVIPNFYVGLVVLLSVSIGMEFIDRIGIEQAIFKYNEGRSARYSDIAGYDNSLKPYFLYRFYWLSLGMALFFIALTLYRRGMPIGIGKLFRSYKQRWSKASSIGFGIFFLLFLSFGFKIYHETNIKETYVSSKEWEQRTIDYEKTYKRYASTTQPRIVDVALNVDLYPSTRDYKTEGTYLLVNKQNQPVDTVFVDYSRSVQSIDFDRDYDVILEDSVRHLRLYAISPPLLPYDTLSMTFYVENEPNSILRSRSPVRYNGTFYNNSVYPSIGYNENAEETDDKIRKKYGLEPKERFRPPTDSIARMTNYISNNADWIDFEAIVSTDPDQIAMVPGNLVEEWEENGRRYFHYRMKRPMLHFYNVISAKYEVLEDQWNDIDITIYYQKGHEYNLDRIMEGAKKGLEYCSKEFSPYQHDQLRILEFPAFLGSFAQSFANTVPFSEGVGFLAMVDDSEEGGVDYPFAITVHEVAHQWWAHQVIGAKAQGSTLMSESLAEYSSLKVLEHEYGKTKMRTFLKEALDKYLLQRTLERKKEQPLIYVENQAHIHYQKGSLALYALSDLIGEDVLNATLSNYVDSVAFQEPPYTTSLEFIRFIREATPDSLHYFIEDMFETITVYNNRLIESSYTPQDDGTYLVEFTTETTKYRADDRGRRTYKNTNGDSLAVVIEEGKKPTQSLPLADYIDIGIFGQEEVDGNARETELYLQKVKISDIRNTFSIVVDEEPREVGIDPYNKLIDTNSEDNRRKVKEKD